jgi:hypothetical protein
VWVGLLFVFGAALAREYDAENLLAQPWHLAIPLVASLVSAGLLFLALTLTITFKREGRPPLPELARRLLGVFWMTAPLAWAYAMPWERLLDAGPAATANLWTLAIVAVWRMALMVRVVNVLYGVRALTAFWPIMLFADLLAFAALSTLDARILSLMGGVRLNDAEEVLRMGALMLMVAVFYTTLVWAIGTLVVLVVNLRTPKPFPVVPDVVASSDRRPWVLAGVTIGLGLVALPFTQAPQVRRHAVESLLEKGAYDEGVELLCTQPQSAFPPHWDPPPRLFHATLDGTGAARPPDVLEIARALTRRSAIPDWVVEAYTPKLGAFTNYRNLMFSNEPPPRLDDLLETLLVWPDAQAYSGYSNQPTWVSEPKAAERFPATFALHKALLKKRGR